MKKDFKKKRETIFNIPLIPFLFMSFEHEDDVGWAPLSSKLDVLIFAYIFRVKRVRKK